MASAAAEGDQALVARLMSGFNLRDLDAMLAALDPDVDFHPLRVPGVEHGYRGHAGVSAWFGRLLELDHQYHVVVSEMELSPTGVTVSGWIEVGDTEPARSPFCAIYRVEDGLITEARHYLSDRATLDRVGIAT